MTGRTASRALAAALTVLPVVLAASLAGCASGTRTVTVVVTRTVSGKAPVPPPPLARVVPARYRTTSIWRAHLSAGRVPEVVVLSVGPATGPLGYHHADLQVLSWDGVAGRWTVAFDAAKAKAPVVHADMRSSNDSPGIHVPPSKRASPILDNADTSIGPVKFAPLLRGARRQLVFSATFVSGGSGYAGRLVVVDFKDRVAKVVYSWYGEGGPTWTIHKGKIEGKANYWAPGDAHCCPIRTYRFTVAESHGSMTEVFDERPWLGVVVREGGQYEAGPLRVIRLAKGSPAVGVLRVGDVILDVLNAPHKGRGIFDKLSLLNAGQSARLQIERGGRRMSVLVRLGSLRETLGQFIPQKADAIDAL